jgi:hypothetical protein
MSAVVQGQGFVEGLLHTSSQGGADIWAMMGMIAYSHTWAVWCQVMAAIARIHADPVSAAFLL